MLKVLYLVLCLLAIITGIVIAGFGRASIPEASGESKRSQEPRRATKGAFWYKKVILGVQRLWDPFSLDYGGVPGGSCGSAEALVARGGRHEAPVA